MTTEKGFTTTDDQQVRGAWLDAPGGMLCVVNQIGRGLSYAAAYPGQTSETLNHSSGILPWLCTLIALQPE